LIVIRWRDRAVLVFTESVKPLYLFVLGAFPDAKPFHTFAGDALNRCDELE
jgi:hypothetical protein